MKTNPQSYPGLKPVVVAAGIAALLFAGVARAQTTPPVRVDSSVRTVELKHADRSFIEKAARAGLDEVEISKVAADRTSNPAVRSYAQKIIAEHEVVHDDLATIATARGVNLPAKDNVAEKWRKRDAKDFDREYIDHMVSAHDDAVKLFEKHAREGDDVEVMAFARKHLAKLQKHLHEATDLKRSLK
jgi:putative membrane protein